LHAQTPNPDEPEPIRLRWTRKGAKTLSLSQQITFAGLACRVVALAKPGGFARENFLPQNAKNSFLTDKKSIGMIPDRTSERIAQYPVSNI